VLIRRGTGTCLLKALCVGAWLSAVPEVTKGISALASADNLQGLKPGFC
jgi:hypothetical protein